MSGTLLLTGFEPFGQWQVNPSWEIARRLDDEQIAGLHVVGRRLPVNWEQTWPALQSLIAGVRPDAILLMGLTSKPMMISVEARGRNRCGEIADNAGKQPVSPTITEDGSDELACTFPVKQIAASIGSLGLPVEVSDDAGAYLCNFVTYKALEWAKSEGRDIPTGFIHLPSLQADGDEAGLTLDDMGSAVTAAIEAISASMSVFAGRAQNIAS